MMECFRRSGRVRGSATKSREAKKPRSLGFSCARGFAASRRAESETRCVGEARRVLEMELGLRHGDVSR